jgi:fermentation-respiration switch protein FrsA (DUF1100 family)
LPIGPILDRLCFWNMPGWLKSYRLAIPHRSFQHQGLEIWQIPHSEDVPTVLFCHGNAGNLRFPNARRDRILALHQAGVNLWAFDYRGYGYSQGHPTERGLYEDVEAVYSLVLEHHKPQQPLVVFGRSLGGAVATYLATELKTPNLLILESTFTSAPEVCASRLGKRLAGFMDYRFASIDRIARLACPCKMIHGTADRIVPYALGRELYQHCPTEKEFVSVVGAGHNNLQRKSEGLYEETLRRWLSNLRLSDFSRKP